MIIYCLFCWCFGIGFYVEQFNIKYYNKLTPTDIVLMLSFGFVAPLLIILGLAIWVSKQIKTI